MNVSNASDMTIVGNFSSIPRFTKGGLFIASITFSLGVLGNVLAISCLVHQKYRKQMRIPGLETFGAFKTLVLILLTVDLAGILLTSPVTFYLYTHSLTLKEGDILCKYSAFSMLFIGLATMASVTAMAVERSIAIRSSLRYHITAKKAKLAAVFVLLACGTICLFPALSLVTVKPMNPGTWCFADWYSRDSGNMIYNLTYASIGIILIVTTVICNILSVMELLPDVNCVRPVSPGSRRRCTVRDGGEKGEHVKILTAMTCIYILCWLPLMERFLYNQFSSEDNGQRDRVAVWLACLNPVLDPWVYILLQKKVLRLVGRCTKSCCSRNRKQESKENLKMRHVRHPSESTTDMSPMEPIIVYDKDCEKGLNSNGSRSTTKPPALLDNRDDSNECNIIA